MWSKQTNIQTNKQTNKQIRSTTLSLPMYPHLHLLCNYGIVGLRLASWAVYLLLVSNTLTWTILGLIFSELDLNYYLELCK